MKIAYLILAHTDPKQLHNMILALDHPDCDFFVHLDKKIAINNFAQPFIQKNNVKFLKGKKRIEVYWGGFNMVKAMLNLLNEASILQKYDRFVFLSGLDYPIKSPEHIHNFFKENRSIEFVDVFNISGYQDHKINNFYYFDLPILPIKNYKVRKIINLIREILVTRNSLFINSKKLKIYEKECSIFFGAQWISLTKESVNYLLQLVGKNPQIMKYFKRTYAPDELFFATLIANSPFKKNMINCSEKEFEYRSPLHVIEYREHVKTYTEIDFEELSKSSKLFCRKVQTTKSEKLVELLRKQNGTKQELI